MTAIGCRKAVRNALRKMHQDAGVDKEVVNAGLTKRAVFNRLTEELSDDYQDVSSDTPNFLERVQKFFEWILEHREEIIAMIKAIIALFASSPQPVTA